MSGAIPGPDPKDQDKGKHRRSKARRELDSSEIWELTQKGWNQFEIAEKLGVSQPLVSIELKKIVAERREYRLDSMEDFRDLVTDQYRMIYKEAYEGWISSKNPSNRVTEEEVLTKQPNVKEGEVQEVKSLGRKRRHGGEKGTVDKLNKVEELKAELRLVKRSKTTEGRSGAPDYLRVMAMCLDAIRELHGLNAPKEVNLKAATINWDVLVDGLPNGPVPDVLDLAIKEVLGYKQQIQSSGPMGQIHIIGTVEPPKPTIEDKPSTNGHIKDEDIGLVNGED